MMRHNGNAWCIFLYVIAVSVVGSRVANGDKQQEQDRVLLLIAQLSSNDERIQRRAIGDLANLGPRAQTAVPALIERLNDPNEAERVRVSAMKALVRIDPAGKQCLGPLRRAMRDVNSLAVRIAAVRAVGELGPAAAEAAADLVPLLSHAPAHGAVFRTANLMGPDAAMVLLEAADSGEPIAPLAAWCLVCMGDGAQPAIERLIEILNGDDLRHNRRAAVLLGRLAPYAAGAVPALRTAAESADAELARLANQAIKTIDAANSKSLLELRRKYFGKLRAGPTTDLGSQLKLMKSLLNEWNPIGATTEELLSIGGPPRSISPTEVIYTFDTGVVAHGFLFETKDGRITQWTRLR